MICKRTSEKDELQETKKISEQRNLFPTSLPKLRHRSSCVLITVTTIQTDCFRTRSDCSSRDNLLLVIERALSLSFSTCNFNDFQNTNLRWCTVQNVEFWLIVCFQSSDVPHA